jgi:hypothetical protein
MTAHHGSVRNMTVMRGMHTVKASRVMHFIPRPIKELGRAQARGLTCQTQFSAVHFSQLSRRVNKPDT